jgi:hypothetical protein
MLAILAIVAISAILAMDGRQSKILFPSSGSPPRDA